MLLIRVQLPDRPGSLGAVATALGTVGADIHAVEIVDRGAGYVIDDFMLTIPSSVLPDTIVSACNTLDGVRVLWLSRNLANWGVESDIATLSRMTADPATAAETLTREAPVLFHSQWAALIRRGTPPRALTTTSLAPDFTPAGIAALGDLAHARSGELTSGWLPGWGETVIAVAPLPHGRAIVVARQGGPNYAPTEITRLRHLANLVGTAEDQ